MIYWQVIFFLLCPFLAFGEKMSEQSSYQLQASVDELFWENGSKGRESRNSYGLSFFWPISNSFRAEIRGETSIDNKVASQALNYNQRLTTLYGGVQATYIALFRWTLGLGALGCDNKITTKFEHLQQNENWQYQLFQKGYRMYVGLDYQLAGSLEIGLHWGRQYRLDPNLDDLFWGIRLGYKWE